MKLATAVINGVFDALLFPLGWLPPIWGLLMISILSGFGMIAVFKAVSDQDGISRLRRRMGGEILGILLHVSSPAAVMKFAGRLIWSNTVYLAILLKPLLVMAVPFVLVWGQLDSRYGAKGIPEDSPVTVTLQYDAEMPERDRLGISADGLELVPPVVMIDTLGQASFRVAALEGGRGRLDLDGLTAVVGSTAGWSGSRVIRGFDAAPSFWSLFTPRVDVVRGVPEGPESGWYSLPGVDYGILGWHWSWEAVFLVFSMISALVGARLFKVRI
ncbi:MAG: hypothetical protein R6U39_05825 [Candidatus Aegiribacteria sp.]